jgi:hypothetical protein
MCGSEMKKLLLRVLQFLMSADQGARTPSQPKLERGQGCANFHDKDMTITSITMQQ